MNDIFVSIENTTVLTRYQCSVGFKLSITEEVLRWLEDRCGAGWRYHVHHIERSRYVPGPSGYPEELRRQYPMGMTFSFARRDLAALFKLTFL